MASVLLSSTGFRMSQHWCGNMLVSASIFGTAMPCAHYGASQKPACPMHTQSAIKKNCCDQREIIVDGNDYEYEVQTMEPVTAPSVLIAFIYCIWDIFIPEADVVSSKYHNHSPPLIGSEIIIRVQSFLL